jgi:hypothetical protein
VGVAVGEAGVRVDGADGVPRAAVGAAVAVVVVGDQDGEQHHQGEHEQASTEGDDQAGVLLGLRAVGLHGGAFRTDG